MPVPRTAQTWADLGCGSGTFTIALASVLVPGSAVHAMDHDASTVRRLPRRHADTSIIVHVGDFTARPWPFDRLDGVLLANSLHYVRDPSAFIRASASSMTPPRRFLIVEYDTDDSSRWVPYPLSCRSVERLFAEAGYASFTVLGSLPSIYRRALIYAAWIESA
jgi:SAM-dependent methyltransferase